ncbi:cytochrome P450 27C1 [Elysia marginata]|uniref:Cholesterol side-chain cleavage enzyme, mitochondrial n=1 Tax=Elysia marginata TaxID=1093978 RepID=A0AAV4GNH0_9GAST|nr:cytochrome P450 27C1 [Elysia marginata]
MAEVLRKEGKYPSRPPYESWVLYNKLRRKDGGLMTSEKEYWKKSRGVLAAKLRPRAVADYVPMMNEVCSDFLARIGMLKQPACDTSDSHRCSENSHTTAAAAEGDNSNHINAPHTVPRMLNELNKFTMETILYVMLNTRVGCLEPQLSEQVDAFIRSIATMFLTGHQLMVYANIHKLLSTRPWREHVQSWDSIYEFGEHTVVQGFLPQTF